ncbi:hypothetical protein N7539_005764 [Penicillium diatomitis]|uniref:Uncharacterized protein n=1 Tax=Penicillium diatomitis TaxID=2819901 RepID=A0A9X0BTT1_9EURO|nr:uncharacterized protein N7539_005764 [Penicillium diatomitis]KAJ5483968.1 hypothetical protein N7539_005764 [Penicillium diatomitis]
MPIPTRSVSLREPRKPGSSIARHTSGKTASSTQTQSPIRGPTSSTNDGTALSRTSSSAEGSVSGDNTLSSRGRTFLPQRSGLSREDGGGTMQAQVRFQAPGTRLARREGTSPVRSSPPQQQQQQQQQQQTAVKGDERRQAPSTATSGCGSPARRQSIRQPSTLKTDSTKGNVPSLSKGTVPTFRPPSPRKAPALRSTTQNSSTAGRRAVSPKRTEILPPPRPARSASLKQPREAGALGPSASVRGHVRHRSQIVTPTTKSTLSAASPATATPRAPLSTARSQTQTPAKRSSKPPTPTPGSTSSPDGILIPTTWPDIASLQTELLQLSLFHSGSLQQQAEWKSAAETRLRQQFDVVTHQYRSIQVDEQRRQYQTNMQSLVQWLQNCSGHQGLDGFSEQIQIFSQVLQEVWDLGASAHVSGQYTRVVAAFEKWLDRASEIWNHRDTTGAIDGNAFIDRLDQSWKDAVRALQVDLELCARRLQSLCILPSASSQSSGGDETSAQSALARVAEGLAESIRLMMQEIRMMRSLEEEIVLSEKDYVRDKVNELTRSQVETEMRAPRLAAWSSGG